MSLKVKVLLEIRQFYVQTTHKTTHFRVHIDNWQWFQPYTFCRGMKPSKSQKSPLKPKFFQKREMLANSQNCSFDANATILRAFDAPGSQLSNARTRVQLGQKL